MTDGVHRHLKLTDDHVCRLQHSVTRSQRRGRQLTVAAGHNDNGVLAAVIDHDQRHTAGAIHRADGLAVDPFHQQRIAQLAAIGVGTDAPHHGDTRPQACRGDGLVGALATGHSGKCLADQGFTGTRQATGAGDQVHVQAAYYHYFCWHTSVLINSVQRYWANTSANGAVDSRKTILGVTIR